MIATFTENPEHLALVAITQDEAKIWRHGIGPEDLPEYVRAPIEVDHRHRRTGQNDHGHDTVHRFPEYFEEIAEMIRKSDAILIMGHGRSKGAYHEILTRFLKRKHPDIGRRILETVTLDLSAVSEGEITKHARDWFEKNFRKLATWHDRQSSKWF
jgi:hypothetical protein